ncbi:hypothetical protein LTR48_009380, partial [Friedmanniomyces endolithicus]
KTKRTTCGTSTPPYALRRRPLRLPRLSPLHLPSLSPRFPGQAGNDQQGHKSQPLLVRLAPRSEVRSLGPRRRVLRASGRSGISSCRCLF